MLMHSPSPKEIKDKLLDLIRQFDAIGRPALLSSLGLLLSKHFGQPFRHLSTERTLASFFRTHMSGEVDLVPDSKNALVLYARPKAQAGLGLNHQVEPSTSSPDLLNPTGIPFPRYDPSFWAAFAKPIHTGSQRFVRREWPFHFVDLPEDSMAPAEFTEVEENFIAPAELSPGPARAQFVTKQIQAWLEKNSMEPAPFLRKPKIGGPAEAQSVQSVTILRVFSRLEKSELERIHMPADVWLKLLNIAES